MQASFANKPFWGAKRSPKNTKICWMKGSTGECQQYCVHLYIMCWFRQNSKSQARFGVVFTLILSNLVFIIVLFVGHCKIQIKVGCVRRMQRRWLDLVLQLSNDISAYRTQWGPLGSNCRFHHCNPLFCHRGFTLWQTEWEKVWSRLSAHLQPFLCC